MRNRNLFSQRGARWCNKPQEQSSVILCSRPDLRGKNASVVNSKFIYFWRLTLSLNAIIIHAELNWANSDWAMTEECICQRWKCLGHVCKGDDRPGTHLIVLEGKGCTLNNLKGGPQNLHLTGWNKVGFFRSGIWGLNSCSQILVLVTKLSPAPLTCIAA